MLSFRPRFPAYPAILSLISCIWFQPVVADVVVDFGDLQLTNAVEYWNGSDGSGEFRSRGARFANDYNPDWDAWSGFSYSRVNDTNTTGWMNQYAVISGTGVGNTGIYAVAYTGNDDATVTLPVASGMRGIYVNNTTYAALDILYGSGFSKKFGGESGDDPDWFKLTVTGYEADGYPSGSASIYLADYRFEDNTQNYILSDWTWMSLTNLGDYVETLHFSLSSSDVGDWGMNTPAYFALGSLVTDESYAPPAGQPGSTAVSMSSNSIIGWATGWTNYIPGAHVDATWQTPGKALGQASGTSYDIVCLGDGGEITMTFDPPIQDGPGPDFAIFANAFDETFLELAYVEVSSDGTNFTRFFNRSLTADPVPFAGANVDATHVTGLAGKYVQGYGEPFDLGDLSDAATAGELDLQNIRYVRLLDIIGDGSYRDSAGHVIYDPHPTTGSAGYDLDAIGVLSNDTSEVSLSIVTAATDKRGVSNARVAVRRKAWNLDDPLEVTLSFEGNAENGLDYETVDPTIVFAAGETDRFIDIRPRPESAGRGDRHVIVRLVSHANYLNGREERVRLFIRDASPYDIWKMLQLRADFNTLPLPDDLEYWNGSDLSGGFTVNGIHFSNHYNTDWAFWEGFAYSRVNDTNTAGFGNQYAVISGTAVAGAGTYVVAYLDGVITLPSPSGIEGFYVNNTTYAALDMLHGSMFTKAFGGDDGNDPDWFKLTVFGHDKTGVTVGSNTIYLADYRFEDNDRNYILHDWTWLCLTNLGMNVKTMTFELTSSDVGDWGMNTPAYFALDGLRVDPDSPSAAATADWSGDGDANLMAYAMGRGLGAYQPGRSMMPLRLDDDDDAPGFAIEFERRRETNGVWLHAELCTDLSQGIWLSGPDHVHETIVSTHDDIDRIRATPATNAAPAYMRLRAVQE